LALPAFIASFWIFAYQAMMPDGMSAILMIPFPNSSNFCLK
jgi:hypothetical protein